MRLFTFIKDGFKGVFRNGLMSLASIFVLLSSLLMIGIFTTLIQNVNYNLKDLQEFKELVCYMELNSTEKQLLSAREKIEKFENVKSVTVVTKDEALKNEMENYKDIENSDKIFEMYEKGRANPLPDSLRVEYYSTDGLEKLETSIKSIAGINKENVRNMYEVAQNIESLKHIITIGGTWLMVLLAVVAVFVIANTIKLTYHSRELEINIMRYIGATKFYITMPFVVESVIISLVASSIGFVSQWYIYTQIVANISKQYEMINIRPYAELNNWFLVIYFGFGLFMGVFGSVITIRKYMKV